MPVVCQCQKRWCLDCGREAHWPVTCTQFNTYTKMLRQNGEFRDVVWPLHQLCTESRERNRCEQYLFPILWNRHLNWLSWGCCFLLLVFFIKLFSLLYQMVTGKVTCSPVSVTQRRVAFLRPFAHEVASQVMCLSLFAAWFASGAIESWPVKQQHTHEASCMPYDGCHIKQVSQE